MSPRLPLRSSHDRFDLRHAARHAGQYAAAVRGDEHLGQGEDGRMQAVALPCPWIMFDNGE